MAADEPARLTVWVAGRVQGVGFRWWARARALELNLVGSAENLEDGRVKVIAEGWRPTARSCWSCWRARAHPVTSPG